MINLLPPQEKNILQREKKYRLCFIWGIFILFFGASFSVILFSINIYLAGEIAGHRILVDYERQKSVAIESQNVEKEMGDINQKLAKLSAFYKEQPKIADFFQKISEIIPEGMYLNSLSLNPDKNKNNSFQVSLTGYGETRETLLDFKKNLESESGFQGVYFPPSSWVKPSDINFSASFEIAI